MYTISNNNMGREYQTRYILYVECVRKIVWLSQGAKQCLFQDFAQEGANA